MIDSYPSYNKLPDLSCFKSRLDFMLGARRLYPWASAIGVSKGAAEKMQKGVIPGSEILRIVHLYERVELTWLVTGCGKPFCIYVSLDAEDLNRTINSYLLNNLNKSVVYLCHDGERIVVAVGTYRKYIYKEKPVRYTDWKMYSGCFSHKLAETLKYHFSCDEADGRRDSWFCSEISADELTGIYRGERSALLLFGDGEKLKPSLKIEPIKDMASALKPLLSRLSHESSLLKENNIYGDLLKHIMVCVDDYCREDAINLHIDQRAKIYTSIYNHCQRTGDSPYSVTPNLLPTLLDLV